MEGKLDLTPVVEGGMPRHGPDATVVAARSVEEPAGISSPSQSSAGHDCGYIGSSPGGSSVPSAPEPPPALPAVPEGLKVSSKNTFIHIESVPVVERIVQSMPDGMFRQCLEAERCAQHAGVATPDDREDSSEGLTGPLLSPLNPAAQPFSYAPPGPSLSASAAGPSCPPPMAEPMGQFIAIGTEVTIQNLVKAPAFNGRSAIVQALDVASGRYDVLIADPGHPSGGQKAKVKREHLIVNYSDMPPPPRYAPTILLEDCIQNAEAASDRLLQTPPRDAAAAATQPWEEDGKTASPPLRLNALV